MSIPNFVEGYPLDGSSLGSSKVQIRNNIDGTFQTLAVDHYDNNGNHGGVTGDAGTHYQAQFKEIGGSSPPSGLSNGYGTVYSQAIAGATELYFVRGNNPTGIQLTGPGSPSAASNGYSFLPGGVLIQWGSVSAAFSGGDEADVIFPLAFPNAVFNIQTTPTYNESVATPSNSGQCNVGFSINKIVLTKFRYRIITNSSAWRRFYWIAIGN